MSTESSLAALLPGHIGTVVVLQPTAVSVPSVNLVLDRNQFFPPVFILSAGLQDQVPSAPQSSASPARSPLHHQEAKHLLLEELSVFTLCGNIKNFLFFIIYLI